MFPIVTSFLEQRELSCCLQFVLVPLQNPAPCLGNCNQYMYVCVTKSYLVEESVHVDHRPHFSHYWRGTGAQKMKKKSSASPLFTFAISSRSWSRPGRGEDRIVAQLVARASRHRQRVRLVGYHADDDDDDDGDVDDDIMFLDLYLPMSP